MTSPTVSGPRRTALRHPRSRSERALQERNARVARHRALVRPIALHYGALCRESVEDLTQVGLLGLLRAAELFRPSEQIPFPAFARHHVRGAILHYLRDQAPTIRLPRRQQELEDRLRRLERLEREPDGRPLGDETLRNRLGLSPGQWQRFQEMRLLGRPVSLDPAVHDLAGEPPIDPSPREERSRVLGLLADLEDRQRRVVQEVVLGGHSLRETARRMGLSPMTIHRALLRALAELRRRLDESSGFSPVSRLHPGPSEPRAC